MFFFYNFFDKDGNSSGNNFPPDSYTGPCAGMTRDEFQKYVKESREKFFTPFDLAYDSFVACGYDKKDPDYFRTNASDFVTSLRNACWDNFVPEEKKFTTEMLLSLIDGKKLSEMSSVQAVASYISEYPEYMYDLSLSNTQSRRSRAGKEFEAILELLFIGADIPVDSQGSIGKKTFEDQGLGKLVDFVSPSVVHYLRNKLNVTLISAKTTLRERWQEVPEEVSRTSTPVMYLATLDDKITENTLDVLYESNIIVATTRQIKKASYNDENRIITFEELLRDADLQRMKWDNYRFSPSDQEKMLEYARKQYSKHENHPFVKSYYQRMINSLK